MYTKLHYQRKFENVQFHQNRRLDDVRNELRGNYIHSIKQTLIEV